MATITIYHVDRAEEVLHREKEDYPSLEELQGWVGGYIETVYFKDDPMGYWHFGYVNEEGLIRGLRSNDAGSKVFPHYPGGLWGPVVTLEGFHRSVWYDQKSFEFVREATREECLAASNDCMEMIDEDGRTLMLAEREDEDDEGNDERYADEDD